MQDELHGRLWVAHHDQFSATVEAALRKSARRLRGVPFLAERLGGQILVALGAISIASTLTLTAGLV